MIELLIIADDLTGAIDTGVQLAKQGVLTTVIIEPDSNVEQLIASSNVQILVFDTESRHIDQKQASERIRKLMKTAKKAGITRYYKKTDSTMRGNIGAELEAFLIETGQRSLPFIPAHPKLNRFTRNGFHYIDRQLLHETAFGHDPLEPVRSSYIPDLIHHQTDLPAHNLDIKCLTEISQISGILIFDCESSEDLEEIGRLLFLNGLDGAISGSAAMAELLPGHLKILSGMEVREELPPPLLIVNGSLNPISHQQVRYAAENGIKVFTIPDDILTGSNIENSQNLNYLISEISSAIDQGRSIILTTTYPRGRGISGISQKESTAGNHGIVSAQTGKLVAFILGEIHVRTLMVIGGDTLLGIMRAIGCTAIEPKTEIFPGVAVSLARGTEITIRLVTKPGGYGEIDVFPQFLKSLNNQVL